ncbi:MAG: hypothetical protein QXX20_00330 [Candidatus Thermoplasmatota archaeon]
MQTSHTPSIIDITTYEDAKKQLQLLDCDPKSIPIMAPKMILKIIKVHNVVLQDAIIIKQDMLSIGGEVAIPKDAFQLKDRCADILIIGTLKQHYELVDKLFRHYPRIKRIAEELQQTIKTLS